MEAALGCRSGKSPYALGWTPERWPNCGIGRDNSNEQKYFHARPRFSLESIVNQRYAGKNEGLLLLQRQSRTVREFLLRHDLSWKSAADQAHLVA